MVHDSYWEICFSLTVLATRKEICYDLFMFSSNPILIGRNRELDEFKQALDNHQNGQVGMIVLSGEAGVGKTHFVNASLIQSKFLILQANASETYTQPYGQIVSILRAYIHQVESAFENINSRPQYLSMIMPELGPVTTTDDPGLLFLEIQSALKRIADRQPTIIFLDDLQWADHATLEILPVLVRSLLQHNLIFVGAYRNEDPADDRAVRRLRHELRRTGQWTEIPLSPLDAEGTGDFISALLGQPPSQALVSTIYQQTRGLPLLVKELIFALQSRSLLQLSSYGLEITPGKVIPIPDTLRDAILIRMDGLSDQAREMLEIAAVLGTHFDLEVLARLSTGEAWLEELLTRRLIVEFTTNQARFTHELTRRVIYEQISWPRRRAVHRLVAETLQNYNAAPEVVAEHWLAAGEAELATKMLFMKIEKSLQIHAYRDALQTGERVLALWVEDKDPARQLEVLKQIGKSATHCGLFKEAVKAWKRVAQIYQESGNQTEFAQTQRRLANLFEMLGDMDNALAAHLKAAEAFSTRSFVEETITERLAASARLQKSGNLQTALEQVVLAEREAQQADRADLLARLFGAKGALLACSGQIQAGCQAAQVGLSLAMKENQPDIVNEVYQHLGTVLEQTANYPIERETYLTEMSCCEADRESPKHPMCMAHIAVVFKQTGSWRQAMAICQELIRGDAMWPWAESIAHGILGWIYACKGEGKRASRHLQAALDQAERSQVASFEITCAHGFAMVDAFDSLHEKALERGRYILDRWNYTEDRFYAIPTLRWLATLFSIQGAEKELHACVDALNTIAAETGSAYALASLSHALGESALLDQQFNTANRQFCHAEGLLQDINFPYELAEVRLRAGYLNFQAGDRGKAVELLVDAYQTSRHLGARPLAIQINQLFLDHGESVEAHLGVDTAHHLQRMGLTPREFEVLQRLALGLTNKDIAAQMVVSTRTVDMHVRNILVKLNCKSRTEASYKAGQLGLLQQPKS